MTNKYSFYVEWSEPDQEFMATCPAFPGLSAFGENEEEALREAKIALAGFIETYKKHKVTLPQAAVHEGVSGKFQLRLLKSLHRSAIRMAQVEGVSLNYFIADAVRSRVAGEQVGSEIVREVRHLLSERRKPNASVMPVQKPSAKYARKTGKRTEQ